MEINADFARPALVRFAGADWAASPLPGVDRLMLDRIGEEVARATSLVRYAPNSRFDAHTHERGEEFFVLEGTFSDRSGDYGPGTYVRNPPGSSHAPHSEEGCLIFVKLRQFGDGDQVHKVIDTNASRDWVAAGEQVTRLDLHQFGAEQVELYRFGGNRRIHVSALGGLEILVLDGSLRVSDLSLERHDWLRLPPGPLTAVKAGPGGARIYVKSGHLPVRKGATAAGNQQSGLS